MTKMRPKQANLTVANNWVGETFNCISNTLEMPFKDNAQLPDALMGWSPERCIYFAEASLIAMNTVIKHK